MRTHAAVCTNKLALLAVVGTMWWIHYPAAVKLRCILCAMVYSFTECAFTFFERDIAYTSAAQFVGNVLYTPVLLDCYGWALSSFPLLYVLLFPVNVWILEIVLGYAMFWIYGRNVAWCYLDYADEYVNGCIRLGHGVWWLGLGFICYFLYPVMCDWTEYAFA